MMESSGRENGELLDEYRVSGLQAEEIQRLPSQ